ncbi:ABC transporter permease [Vagococcus intermedius]|uniref:ABC transporter permease n=1 Tax=Vagococcus intermedius TaxID=2991418 RepID=A0AAF0I9T2_9ENTE|nr:ABC transporter permease [Vagococcus intermedius]WEG73727.1 ABC transporter permease [Vagococcus intermedius]WEG75812.1 ABC transporter permease [Vagococcus intermedius]
MDTFYKKRLNQHQNKLMRYLKYVFNDHIVLVSTFLLGGFGFYYADFVKTLSKGWLPGQLISLLILFSSLFIGKLATLAKEADFLFLLPKEKEMTLYLKQAYRHSLSLPFIAIALITGMLMPLMIALNRTDLVSFIIIIASLWGLKASHLAILLSKHFVDTDKQIKKLFSFWLITAFITSSLIAFDFPIIALLLATIMTLYFLSQAKKIIASRTIAWEYLIETEQQRLKVIYQFINLFTDVPGITTKTKRRKWLDPLFTLIKPVQANTYYYLFLHSFLRSTTFSGLALRLVLIGSIILAFLDDFILIILVAMVFIYLIGFQLIPLYKQFDYMLMTQLYPVSHSQQKQAITNLISQVILVSGLIFTIVSVFNLQTLKESLGLISALVSEIVLLTFFYIPSRLKKMDRF